MTEKLETGNVSPEQPKITNLTELKILLEEKFGKYSFFVIPILKRLSGYEAPKSMFPDTESERAREEAMLKNTKVTHEIIDSLNKVLINRASTMKQEVEFAKKRKNEERQKECQKILDLFKNKQLILTEKGTVEVQESNAQ